MKTLPTATEDSAILALLEEWTELLACEKYEEALALLSPDPEQQWTPALLASAVYGYGCPGYTREEAARVFGRADYKVTSLRGSPCRERILRSVDICRFTPKACPETLGMVHYFNIPLNGEMSDLTGIFYLRKLSETSMTLEFHDLHVM